MIPAQLLNHNLSFKHHIIAVQLKIAAIPFILWNTQKQLFFHSLIRKLISQLIPNPIHRKENPDFLHSHIKLPLLHSLLQMVCRIIQNHLIIVRMLPNHRSRLIIHPGTPKQPDITHLLTSQTARNLSVQSPCIIYGPAKDS